jgi:hypothetical protein
LSLFPLKGRDAHLPDITQIANLDPENEQELRAFIGRCWAESRKSNHEGQIADSSYRQGEMLAAHRTQENIALFAQIVAAAQRIFASVADRVESNEDDIQQLNEWLGVSPFPVRPVLAPFAYYNERAEQMHNGAVAFDGPIEGPATKRILEAVVQSKDIEYAHKVKRCAVCNNPFLANNKNREICSHRCNSLATWRRSANRKNAEGKKDLILLV